MIFKLQKFLLSSQNRIFPLYCHSPLHYSNNQIRTYVNVYMKWKRDPFFDSIDSIHKSIPLKPIVSLKNFFASNSSSDDNYSIPISMVSKKGLQFGISIKVARFLRSYPSFFEEFKGPLYGLPWFRLTQKAIDLHNEEMAVYEESRGDIVERLKKFISMTGARKTLPLKVIKGLQWQLGLPGNFSDDPLSYVSGHGDFRVVDLEDGLKGLTVFENVKFLSMMQKKNDKAIEFPLFPSKGVRLKQKVNDWLYEFQRLPYVSPYEDLSRLCLSPDSDESEKRVVALLHEVLCLFVEHAAERKSFICLRKYFGLPQKVHKAFERHPHMFYLSMKNKTCTAILKEAYRDEQGIESHPIANVRKRYIQLMKESSVILRNRRNLTVNG